MAREGKREEEEKKKNVNISSRTTILDRSPHHQAAGGGLRATNGADPLRHLRRPSRHLPPSITVSIASQEVNHCRTSQTPSLSLSLSLSLVSTCRRLGSDLVSRSHHGGGQGLGMSEAESGGGSGSGGGKDQDRFLPIANIGRIMRRAVPENGKIAKDAKESIQECVSEFISFITSE